jgi:hypothetical protein
MKAIVLTYDGNRILTDHMIEAYRSRWRNHPFVFRVPYQLKDIPISDDREYIRSSIEIRSTTLTLISDLKDDDWIYWCIDDKYPIKLHSSAIAELPHWVQQIQDVSVSGILFCRCRNLLKQENLESNYLIGPNGLKFLERRNYNQIWIHQFLRVKVLKHIFNSMPQHIPSAKAMDGIVANLIKPKEHRLFVSESNQAVFGESTSRGKLTRNCYESLVARGFDVSDWEGRILKESITMGNKAILVPSGLASQIARVRAFIRAWCRDR